MKGPLRWLALGLAAWTMALVCGCASRGLQPPKDLGRQKVVARTPDDRPKWLEVPFREKDKFIYFSGHAMQAADRALGLQQAKADALRNLMESVRVRARSEFSEAVRGTNTSPRHLGRYLDSVIAWTTGNLDLSGAVPVEQYVETVQTRGFSGYSYSYNCHVWLRLPREEYLRARELAAARAVGEAPDEQARELAREAKEKLER